MTSNLNLETRFNYFVEKFKNTSIENYFNIINIDNEKKEKVNITFNIKNNYIYLNIYFFKNYNFYNILQLPDEINKEIYHYYNFDYIKLNLKIYYSHQYPFKPPIWVMVDLKHNIEIPIDLLKYYTEIISYHNNLNHKQWSPSINIHHDILDFVQKINHFDYMLDKNNFI
jgi:hypothetical protein